MNTMDGWAAVMEDERNLDRLKRLVFAEEGHSIDREGLVARAVAALDKLTDYRMEGVVVGIEAAAARCPR